MSTVDRQYLDLIEDITVDGQDIQSRNSLTRRITTKQITFDSTPLISVRRTAWKQALREMEYFLNGGTHLDELHKSVHHWWSDFCDTTPKKMHHSYGHCFRRIYQPSNKVIKVYKKPYIDDYVPFKQDMIDPVVLENKGPLTGKALGSGESRFIVLDIVGKRNTNYIYRIQFINSGFIKEYRSDVIKDLRVKNPYGKTVYGVGYFGEPEKHSMKNKIQKTWFHMMGRCYNTKDSSFETYKDVNVCYRWHNFANFLNDFSKLDGYENWINDSTNYQLDKDHYGSKIYSPENCIIIPRDINTRYSKSKGKFVLEKSNEFHEFLSEIEVANFLEIPTSSVKSHSKKMIESGYSLKFYPNREDFNYRNEILIDQLDIAIDKLKNDPYSRRNVITTWIPQHVNAGLINPTNCHGSIIQFFVNSDNTVDMTMYQRSADVMLGVPHNWIQYWALLQYLCHQSGREVGKFTWTGGDIHIYEKHFEAADKVRYSNISHIETPTLTYNPTSDNFKAEDFSLDGEYKPLIKESLELIV